MLEQWGSDARTLVLKDNLQSPRMFIGKQFNLTSGSANALFVVPMAALNMFSCIVHWSLQVTDGTDVQCFTGISTITAVNKAGTITSTVTELAGIQSKTVTTGTLTESITITTQTNPSTITINMTPTTSLTPTVLTMDFNVMVNCGDLLLPSVE